LGIIFRTPGSDSGFKKRSDGGKTYVIRPSRLRSLPNRRQGKKHAARGSLAGRGGILGGAAIDFDMYGYSIMATCTIMAGADDLL
jgi:hypothetical protein